MKDRKGAVGQRSAGQAPPPGSPTSRGPSLGSGNWSCHTWVGRYEGWQCPPMGGARLGRPCGLSSLPCPVVTVHTESGQTRPPQQPWLQVGSGPCLMGLTAVSQGPTCPHSLAKTPRCHRIYSGACLVVSVLVPPAVPISMWPQQPLAQVGQRARLLTLPWGQSPTSSPPP